MAILVQKFGGTSVGSTERILHVAKIIAKKYQQGDRVIVVVSAINGETNRLIQLANQISKKPNAREYDALLATGEQASASLLSMVLQDMGFNARSYCGLQLPIFTTDEHRKADIVNITVSGLLDNLHEGVIPIVTGFQGVGRSGQVTTLGRGGSDVTAVALAAATNADECQIYTDVDGVYSCDPRIVPAAYRLDEISVQEMLEMAQSGAKVMQSQAMRYAATHQVPLRVLSSFESGQGTSIQYRDQLLASKEKQAVTAAGVTGMALALGQSMFSLQYLPCEHNKMVQLLANIRQKSILIDDFGLSKESMITGFSQNAWIVSDYDKEECLQLIEAFFQQHYQAAPVLTVADNLVRLSLIGRELGDAEITRTKLQALLNELGVQIYAEQYSALRVSFLLHAQGVERVARNLHHHLIEIKANWQSC